MSCIKIDMEHQGRRRFFAWIIDFGVPKMKFSPERCHGSHRQAKLNIPCEWRKYVSSSFHTYIHTYPFVNLPSSSGSP
jgi:hypothetical protein